MNNQAKLKALELDGKERYYYARFGKGAISVPDGFMGIATVCLLPTRGVSIPPNVVGRGIAFCNPRDQFVKKLGRNVALGRAIKALERGASSEPVPLKTPAAILITEGISFLSEFNPALTAFEQKLVKNSSACEGT